MPSYLLGMILLIACATSTEPLFEPVTEIDTDQGRYHLLLDPIPDPPTAGDATLHIDLISNKTGESSLGAAVSVTPWMPDHGHGIADDVIVEELGMGEYAASWVYSMSGYWELTITIDADNGEDEVIVGYEVE